MNHCSKTGGTTSAAKLLSHRSRMLSNFGMHMMEALINYYNTSNSELRKC